MDPIKTAMLNPGTQGLDRIRPHVDKALSRPESKETEKAVPFSDLLNQRFEQPATKPMGAPGELKFSAHAKARLQSRSIDLSPDDLVKMQEAVQRASSKGSKESLILTDKAAFVVSVKNNTVITAVDRDSLKDNVFTNIDSTVMI